MISEEEQKSDKKFKEVERVYLRNYSKIIFFYPLFLLSCALWIVELIIGHEVSWLGFLWIIVFFINLLIIAFDVNSTSFFVILLVIIIVVIIFVFAILPYQVLPNFTGIETRIGMTSEFYFSMTLILGLALLMAVIATRFNYWRVERNEVYHKKGVITSAERFPTRNLRYIKKYPDIFELLLLGAGEITLVFSPKEIFHLHTILGISKKSRKLDYLLSDLEVEIDDLNTK